MKLWLFLIQDFILLQIWVSNIWASTLFPVSYILKGMILLFYLWWINCARKWASIKWDLRILHTRNINHHWLFFWVITAFLENWTVWVLDLGRANFANTTPAMHEDIITPMILCKHTSIIVSGHLSVVARDPYL